MVHYPIRLLTNQLFYDRLVLLIFSNDNITNKDMYLPLGTTVNKQGRIARENAAGGNARFRGIAGSAITKVFDLFVGKTGLSSEEALRNSFDPIGHNRRYN